MTVILNVNPGLVSDEFAMSLYNLQGHVEVMREHTTVNICHARNKLVRRFLYQSTEATALLLDSDIVFPPDLIDHLGRKNKELVNVPYVQPNSGQLIERGLGCTYVTRRVLDDIQAHFGDMSWFREDYVNGQWVGEDHWFFDQCSRLGYEVHVDKVITLGHHKYRKVWYPHES